MNLENRAKLICGTLSDDHPDDWDSIWLELSDEGREAYLRAARSLSMPCPAFVDDGSGCCLECGSDHPDEDPDPTPLGDKWTHLTTLLAILFGVCVGYLIWGAA